jgi:protease-4
MSARFVAIVLLVLGCALPGSIRAQDSATTQPSTRPTTAPTAMADLVAKMKQRRLENLAVASSSTTRPTTGPSAQQAKFPTPAELVAKFKQIKDAKAALTKVAYIDLSDTITEKPAGFSLFGGADTRTLHDLIDRLHKARDDKDIRAVLITQGADMKMNLAQAQEVRDALLELRRAGKKTFVYADSYDTTGYTLASGATNICLLEGGEIMIPGIGFETMFYKGTLDKVGVQADYIQIGEFKGAEEPYTRTGPSEELRGELSHLAEALFNQVIDGISLSRNISSATVRQLVDDAMMTGQVAKERGLVDHLVDADGLRDLLKEELGNDVNLIKDYGEPAKQEVDLSNPWALITAMSKKPEASDKPAVAVIYAQGVITDGDGEGSMLSSDDGVGSEAMRRSIRTAARDENIKAVVIRIDSPGGSALASEVMWQAVRHLSQDTKKPVIISVGGMAASGGYYLASAGDYIFADRCAIVGSIGVVGGKFVMKDLYEKLGLGTETFTQGRNADLFSSNAKWTDRQRRMVRTWMQQTYDQFTQRVMTTRTGKIQDIDKVARGRIFLAQQAKELGLVDELGGCETAITYAAGKAGLEAGSYDIRTLPAPRTLADYLGGGGGGRGPDAETRMALNPKINISLDSALLALPPSARQLAVQQVQMLQLMQRRPVVLMAPYVLDVK